MGFFKSLFSSPEDSEECNSITIDINSLSWKPQTDEHILVAHEKCQMLNDSGTSLASTQYFTCCITDKGMVIIPEGDYKIEKSILGLGLSAIGIKGFAKYVSLKYLYENYIDSPIYVYRVDIKHAEFGFTSVMNGMFMRHFAKIYINDQLMLLCVKDPGYGMDIVASIGQPELFKE